MIVLTDRNVSERKKFYIGIIFFDIFFGSNIIFVIFASKSIIVMITIVVINGNFTDNLNGKGHQAFIHEASHYEIYA